MIIIPKSVKVAGVEYTVEQKPVVIVREDRNYQGSCDYLKTKIEILQDASEERKKEVFFHELTHAIFYEAGFVEQDEDMINRVGKVLHQVVKNNPKLIGC